MRASEIQPRKLVVFDIDDTLVYTQTKVHVVKDGKVVNSLNSHDFTHYKLKPGESFDFGDFSNAKEFFDNSKPNIPMMNQLKRDINTGNKVVMVTARSDFDDKELFLDTFRKFGVDIDKVHVYRAGNSKQGTTEERKKQIIDSLLNKDDYSKAIMYDDAKPNLHTFVELKKDHPKTRFYAWHVSLDGAASEYMREGIVAEKKRRKRRPRWAAYGPGPYGGYGYYAGYSGDGGSSGGDGGGGESIKHEASYPGNIGMMELAKFFQMADQSDKDQFKEFLERGKKGLAWKLVQDIVGVKLQGQEFGEDVVTELKITDKDVQQIIKDKLAIDADSGVEAMRLAIEKMSSLPSTPYVRSQSAQLMMLYKQAKMSIGGDYYRKLNQLAENFADGKNPQDKGDSKRHGINTKASVSSLRKTAKQGGRKGQLAHWLANMKAGRAKKNK